MKLTAATVTRIAREATGSNLLASRYEPTIAMVRVSQRYAVTGALTPSDTRARRQDRAHVAAIALRARGYVVEQYGDRLDVTVPR